LIRLNNLVKLSGSHKKASGRFLQQKGLSVLTESANTTSINNKHIFENDFAFITSDGEVKLKKNSLFEERAIARVDPDSAEKQVEALENAFKELQGKVDDFLKDAENLISDSSEKAEEALGSILDEVKQTDAIGDFEGLVKSAKDTFEKLKESASQKQEEFEPEDESVETAAEAPEKEELAEPEAKSEEVVEEASEPEAEPEPEPEPVAEAEVKDKDTVEEVAGPVEEEQTKAPAEDEVTAEASEEAVDAEESPLAYYRSLGEKATEIAGQADWSYVAMEFDNIDLQWSEGPDAGDEDIKSIRKEIDRLREEFEAKKKAHYEEQKRIRLENLEKKKTLLSQLREIVDQKKWNNTRDVARIKGRWEHVKPIPADEAEKLQEKFDSLLATFDEHKVDRLVKQKQQEEDNLTLKLVILEKMDSFVESLGEKSDWQELEKKFDDLSKQFRKIGRVPAEKNQEAWDRYHTAQDTFHSLRFKHDARYRKEIERFLSLKKKLIDEAEALIDADDLADAAREVNKLHRRWKKVGNLPQKDENEMWDRFKAATDAFNKKKSDNADLLRDQEEQNYSEKQGLIEKATELKDSEDWEQTHKEFQQLMDKWKQIGPVPKRKSGKIWKKFKSTMDHFYDRRRDHFKEVKEERKDNLKEKEDILESLARLKEHDDPIKAVEEAKPLQDEFKKAGYVPIKHKNRLWKEYREICDVIYDRFRAAKAAVDIVGRQNLDQFSADDIAGIRKKQNELTKLRKQTSKLEGELIQMKESLSYFKPTGGTSPLLDDVKKRIADAEQDLEDKDARIADLEREIDMMKKED
jgi:hypothetical protein